MVLAITHLLIQIQNQYSCIELNYDFLAENLWRAGVNKMNYPPAGIRGVIPCKGDFKFSCFPLQSLNEF